MIKWTLPLATLLASATGFAQTATKYECNMRVFGADNSLLIEEKFGASESGGTHARDANRVFSSADGRTQVTVAVDGK